MENSTKGLIGLAVLLAAFGGTMFLQYEQLDKTYVCPLNEQVGIFDRISSTGKTAYFTENSVEKSVSCRSGNNYGVWMPIKKYAESKGISVNELMQAEPTYEEPTQSEGIMWRCSNKGCTRLK